jgi:hypothetical protein
MMAQYLQNNDVRDRDRSATAPPTSRCEVPLMLPSNSIIAASSTLAASRLELEWLLFAQCYEIILAGRRAADECGIVRG